LLLARTFLARVLSSLFEPEEILVRQEYERLLDRVPED